MLSQKRGEIVQYPAPCSEHAVGHFPAVAVGCRFRRGQPRVSCGWSRSGQYSTCPRRRHWPVFP